MAAAKKCVITGRNKINGVFYMINENTIGTDNVWYTGGKEEKVRKEVSKYTKKIPLQVNHIDGNSSNTVPKNIELICPNCHSLTSTYGALNKGNGRKSRYKKGKNENRS